MLEAEAGNGSFKNRHVIGLFFDCSSKLLLSEFQCTFDLRDSRHCIGGQISECASGYLNVGEYFKQ